MRAQAHVSAADTRSSPVPSGSATLRKPRASGKTQAVLDPSSDTDDEGVEFKDDGEPTKAMRSCREALRAREAQTVEVRPQPGGAASSGGNAAGLGGGAAAAGATDPGTFNLLVNMEILKLLKQKTGDPSEREDAGYEGLRILKTFSRMRHLRQDIDLHPGRTVREYYGDWEEELHARGKPWRKYHLGSSRAWSGPT